MRQVGRLLLCVAFLLLAASGAHAQPCQDTHCDILTARLMITGEDCPSQTFDPSQTVEYSRLVTGALDLAGSGNVLYPNFGFDERLDGSFSANAPGFFSVASPCNAVSTLSRLAPERHLYVDFLTEVPTAGGAARNLLYWDGVDDDMNGLDEDDVDWSPVPIDEILRLTEAGNRGTADGGTSEITGIPINQTSTTGGIHTHIDFDLRRSGGGLATFGVYLAKLDVTMPGFAEGAPIYMVFATTSTPVAAEMVARSQVENELVMPLCADGIDNDRDGLIDFAGGDPGCDSAADDSEKSPLLECDDGIDNEPDGFIDFRVPDFTQAADLEAFLTDCEDDDPANLCGLYALRDQQCASPSDPSGESAAPAVPVLGPGGMGVLSVLLAFVGARRLRSLRVRRGA